MSKDFKKIIDKLTNDETIRQLADSIEFEKKIYEEVANSTKVKLIPLPFSDGDYPAVRELKETIEQIQLEGNIALVELELDTCRVIYNLNGDINKIGIVPLDDPRGFYC